MKLIQVIENLIFEGVSLETIRQKYVGDPIEGEKHKRISEKQFEEIIDVAKNKLNLIVWLTVRVSLGLIHETDIYKFKEYFPIFYNNQSKFPHKDINQYKTKEDINGFIEKCVSIREKNITLTPSVNKEDEKNYVTPNEIQKLENVGIIYLGMSDGYQVFEIPNELKDDDNAWKVYRDILGRCAGREQGAKIDICTIADVSHFKYYLDEYGGSYFVIFNLGDTNSPYQIHFESKQFMDKNDRPLL